MGFRRRDPPLKGSRWIPRSLGDVLIAWMGRQDRTAPRMQTRRREDVRKRPYLARRDNQYGCRRLLQDAKKAPLAGSWARRNKSTRDGLQTTAEAKASGTHCGRRKAMRSRRVMILVCHLRDSFLRPLTSDDEQLLAERRTRARGTSRTHEAAGSLAGPHATNHKRRYKITSRKRGYTPTKRERRYKGISLDAASPVQPRRAGG